MNPSSLGIDNWLRRAKGSAVQRQMEMYKYFGSELFDDEGSHAVSVGARAQSKLFYAARQQVTCSLNDI